MFISRQGTQKTSPEIQSQNTKCQCQLNCLSDILLSNDILCELPVRVLFCRLNTHFYQRKQQKQKLQHNSNVTKNPLRWEYFCKAVKWIPPMMKEEVELQNLCFTLNNFLTQNSTCLVEHYSGPRLLRQAGLTPNAQKSELPVVDHFNTTTKPRFWVPGGLVLVILSWPLYVSLQQVKNREISILTKIFNILR